MLNKIKNHWPFIVGGIVVGMIFMKGISPTKSGSHSDHTASGSESSEKKIKFWTCSMHPQIKMPEKGLCPLCGMDLIPLMEGDDADDDSGIVSLKLNKKARKLAEIETTEVIYKEAVNEIRLVGKVDYDETRLSYISAWIAGRMDRLYVDFTGIKVRKGDHLIKLYSPELLAAQEEYLQAIKNLEETKGSELGILRSTSESTLKSSREKLRLYGISEKQIQNIVKRGKPQEHMTINSPVTGTVIHKNGFEGMYVKTGDKVYTIADLSQVWLFLEAYESDIQWLHYGQKVTIEAESFPGQKFHGKIAFIEPFVNEKTRTIKLRVNVDNKNEKLKPGMFVRTTIKSVVGEGGKVYEEELAGKWICPMHPDIVKDHQAPCDICGMDLIKTKEFGFAESPSLRKKVLIIPKTAALITGKRAVVYVENINDETGIHRYEGREVVLGPRAGKNYIIASGLKEGERVVIKGNFKIDSALQIQAKPSMMNPAGYYSEGYGVISGTVSSDENAGLLVSALPSYLNVSKALAGDDVQQSIRHLKEFRKQIKNIIEKNSWTDISEGLVGEVNQLQKELSVIDLDIKSLRKRFGRVSLILKNIFSKYEYKEDIKFFLSFCPMALGNGAYWLQDSDEVKNPYYGESMLGCGEIQKEYGRKIIKQQPKGSTHNH
ncbi:Probable Co/Zn/Cd efflux system membrane fusion protein [hydrothermal vent metagenome]|uniref:Probable Co/Zn/Cd efflux system membrane fusion protein n=1 Tax=hydrothermal vent metagenome TaxID=652676 RepID=A0A3B1DKM6_9ZZZZ